VTDAWLLLLVSPFVGRLLGTLILRLPEDCPVVLARPSCPSCGRRLGARDLIPLLSYLALSGRCRRCHAPIGRFHLMVELVAIGVSLSVLLLEPDADLLWVDAVLGWSLLTLAWIDVRTLWLPDVLTLPLLALGLAVAALLQSDDLMNHVAGACAGYGSFGAISAVYRWLRGHDGLGGGDAKLMGVAGAWLGLMALPWVATLAALGCLLWISLGSRNFIGSTVRYPFGPSITMAIWVSYFISK
jgi:leader peptidase (prepilin peptidase)/N-methyltransferase